MHSDRPQAPLPSGSAKRAGLAGLLLLAGLALAGLDLRPLADEAGLRMLWSFFGHPLASGELGAFATRLDELLPLLASSCLGLSVLLGVLAARALAARVQRRAGPGFKLASALACAAALNPWVLHFVAARDAFSAPRYLDAGDLFRALGLTLAAGALALALPARRVAPTPAVAGRNRPGSGLALAMLAAALLPSFVLPLPGEGPPLTNDEHAYLFQARLFAQGELVQQPGALADFFPAQQTQIDSGRVFSKYPPGHSALLAPGTLVGWPLLVPRLLAALSVLLVWSLGRRFGLARPELAAWMFALSPAFLGVEALALSHGTSLPMTLLFVVCALGALDAARARPPRALALAALAGLALSLAFAARPVTALAVALPVLVLLVRERPPRALALVGVTLLAALPAAGFFLWVNRALTGDALQTAYGLYNQAGNSIWGAVDARTAFEIGAFNLGRISVWLSGIAAGPWLCVVGWTCGRREPRAWLLVLLPACLFAAYALHPFQGIPWCGPVYLVEALPCLVLLAASGLEVLEGAAGRAWPRAFLAAGLAGSAWLLGEHFTLAREELRLRDAPRRAAVAAGIERGVVFVRLDELRARRLHPLEPPRPGAALVFARELGPRDEELLDALGNPPAWVFDPRTGELGTK